MEEEKRRRKVEAGKAKLAEFRQRKAKGDVANPEKEKKKGKRTPLHQHGLSTEEHALTAGEMEVGVETIVEAGLGEQIPSVDDAPGGLGSVEPETTEDRSSEVPSLPTDRDTDGLMALEITQFEAAIQQRDEIITQLSANLQQALSSRDGVQQETQHLTTHIQSLQQQLQQASEMLRSTRQWTQTQELVQAQQQLSTCQNLLCEKTSELNRLRSRLELAHATRQPGAEGSLGTRPDGLAQEGAADHEEHTLILQKELQESKTIASQLEATISQKEAIILTLQQTLPSKDKAPTSTSTSPTGTERAAFCELTEKVGEAERTVTELQREVSSKDLALEDLRMRLSASAEKEQQLSRENVKLFNDLDNLAKKQGHLDGNLTEVAESNWERREGELRTALGEERDQQVAALRSEMQREVERLQAVIEDLTESNRRSHESLLLLEESNGQLNTSLRDSQAQLASGQEQLSSVLSESTEMDARYGRELENFRVKLEMLENERTEARARVAELEELNAELSFGREEAQRALEQIREQQEKDTEGLRVALGLEYKGSIDKLTADIENLTVALSQSAEELRSTKETLQRQYIEEMKGLKESLRQEHKENVNKLLADNEKLTAELSLGKEVVKSELGNVPTDENDPLGIRDKCNREVENEKDADVQEYKENLEKLEAELEKLRGDLVHNTREAQSALEEQRQQHIAEVESLKDTLGQQHKGSLDKLLADIQNLTVMLSQHEQEAQSTLEKQQQQHLIDKEAQKATLDQEHKGNIDKLLGDLKRLKEELLNNKEEAQCSLEKMKQQHSIEMEGLKETLRQENRVTMDKLQAEVEKLNNERSQSRQEADSRYEQMQQDYSRQVEQLKEQRMGVQDDACRLEQLLQHHREEVEALKEALRLEHKGAVDKLLNDTETLNAELSLSRQGAREAQEQLQQQQSLHTEEVQSICEQHIKELETLKETTGQEHAIKVDKLTADIEKLGAELSLRREEEQHATVELQEQHARELERLKESLAQEHKLNTDKLLAELEKIHGLTLKDSQEKQKDIDDLAKQLEEKHRLSLELALKGAENQSKVANEESKAELESKHAEELAALKEDFREKVEKLIQENKSFELEQLETEEGISGILRELEYCATFQETLEISGSTCDNVEASGPALVPSNPSGKAVANPQESPPKPDDDTASQKQGRQLKQLLCALSRQCIAMKGRVQAHVLEKNLREPAAQYQCESEPAPDASPHSVVDGGGTAGAKSSGGGDQTQGQSATTISTAVPSADEFNALLQEKAALEERVGDLRKTCDLQQEEMASLKAQAASDDEVAEEEKEVVVRKGRGGVAHLNVGSQGDVQTRLVEELDLPGATGPSPQAALSHVPQVEQASGVQVSLLKGWASGSPPHHGIDDKATTAPPPAEQEACEDGVQQQQQQQHHGQTDSESEQKSKTQLEKQEAELQEQAGRVMVQVQVQQKGQKQQQQRKHHRKQQKKHPGMVLVQHMSVVPEEGQEDQFTSLTNDHLKVVQEDVDRRGDGTELPPSGILSELRKILNDGGDHTSDCAWSRSLGEVLRRALQEINSSATSGEAGTNRAANLDYRALGPQKPVAAEGCSNAAQSWKGQITELLRLLSMLESRTIQKCGEQENPDAKLFRSLEAELHSLQVLLDIKHTEVELLQQQVQAWGDQQHSAEVKQKMKKSTFTHFQVSLEDLNASVRGEGGNGALLNGDSFALQKQVLQKQDEIVSLQEKIQELQPLGRQVKEMETIFHGLKRQLVQKESAIVSLQSLVCELRLGRRGLEGGCREEPEHGAQDPSDVAHMTLAAGKDPELQCLQSCISEVDHLKERLNSMSRGAETLRSQLSQKEVEAEKFELCVTELETLKQQLDYVARDCDGLKDRLAVKNVEMQTMLIPPVQEAAEGQPGEAIRSYQSLCAQLEWQNTEIRSLRAHIVELEVLRHQFHSLREDYTSLKWQLSQKDDEIDTMEFRIQELQSVYSGFMDESHEQVDSLGSGKTSPALPQQTSAAADRERAQNFDTTTTAATGASNPESECRGADAAHSAMWSQTDAAATAEAEASCPNAAATAAAFGEDGKGEQRREHGGRTAVQCGAQADKDDAKRWDMPSSQAALQVAVDAQRASLEEVHALRLALAMKEEELEALRVCMSTPQGAVELAGESGSHSEEDAAEPSHADSDGRQQTQLSKVAKDKAAATMSKNLPSQQLLLAALEGPMPEPDTDTTGDTVCTKAALSVADSEHPIQGQHLHLESVPPQKDLARGWQKSGPCRGSSPSQGTIPGETRKLSRKETMNKQKPAGRSANVKKEPASQTKPSSRAARATPPMALPCGTCTQLEAERDDLVEVLRMEREACQHLRQRLQVLQQERSRPAIGGDADVAGSVPSRGDRSTGRGDLDVEQRTGSPCELVEGATPGGTDCGDQSEHVETRREEPDGPSLPVIEGSASGVGTEMQASTCVKAAEKLSLLSGSRTEEGTADTEMSNGNRDIAGPSEGSGLVACDGSSSSRTAGLSSNSTDLSRRHGLLQCACRRLQLVSTTTRDLLAQISIRVISVVDLTRDEELAQLLRRLKELDAEIAHSEADLTWDSRLASGDPLGRVARQLSELYGRMTVLSEEKEALNAVVLDLTRLLQQREQTPPPRLTGGPEPAPTWRSDRQLVPPPRRASRGSPASERAMLCVPIGKFQSLHRRFTRAESQRRALLHQKRYLLLVLGSFAGTEQPALALLARPRVELLLIARETAANAATRRRFRVVARAVAATCRLRMLLQKQQQQQRQRGCTAHGWKVDMPVTTFSTPGRHYLWS
ncbi:A-kinase anchor protein 9-like isoform X4 [Lethenteron reissneri]|uniref:A-kinase anchor protein 9-like isoform X4 n=1 Tax=Lethenteron reissneri TaxID=7753 RepID=UPI002AB64296|nr:A-kinase anchor protein 9-like isoform X4 [Lethenteron reissneri]